MLVCNVSLRPRRTVAGDLAEAATAIDTVNTLGLGQLVSDAASATATVDAILVAVAAIAEAASAADAASATAPGIATGAVSEFATANTFLDASILAGIFGPITEAASADSAQDASTVSGSMPWAFDLFQQGRDVVLDPTLKGGLMSEAASAASLQDATLTITHATWDAATASNVTFSGGNLVATSTGGTTDHGCHVAAASGQTSGKYYFEVTITTNASGGDTGIGIGTATSTYSGMGGGGGVTGDVIYLSGNVYAAGGLVLTGSSGLSTGSVVGIAVDLGNRKFWYRIGAAGNWNWNASYNPATNTGGVTIPAGTMVPFATFSASGNVFTANFGASAFSGAVPSGFTSGWS